METVEFLNRMEELLEIKAGTLLVTTQLADLPGWDSMAVLGFIALTDEVFGTTPSPKAIAECRTVADLMALSLPA